MIIIGAVTEKTSILASAFITVFTTGQLDWSYRGAVSG